MAPYNVLMYMFSAVPNRPYVDVKLFPELKPLSDNWQMMREEALQLFDEGHIRAAAKYNDLGFNSFFRRGWKRFYVKWYDEPLRFGDGAVPEDGRAGAVDPIGQRARCSRCCRPAAIWASTAIRSPARCAITWALSTPNSDNCRIFVDGEPY